MDASGLNLGLARRALGWPEWYSAGPACGSARSCGVEAGTTNLLDVRKGVGVSTAPCVLLVLAPGYDVITARGAAQRIGPETGLAAQLFALGTNQGEFGSSQAGGSAARSKVMGLRGMVWVELAGNW